MPKTEFFLVRRIDSKVIINSIHSFVCSPPTNYTVWQACCSPLTVHQDRWVLFCRAGVLHQLFLHNSLGDPEAGRCSGRGKPSPADVTEEPGGVPPFQPLIWSSPRQLEWSGDTEQDVCDSNTPVIISTAPPSSLNPSRPTFSLTFTSLDWGKSRSSAHLCF